MRNHGGKIAARLCRKGRRMKSGNWSWSEIGHCKNCKVRWDEVCVRKWEGMMIIRGGETKNDRMRRRIGKRRQNHGQDIAKRICQARRRKKTARRKLDGKMNDSGGKWVQGDVERMKYGKEWYERRNEINKLKKNPINNQ